LSLVLFLLTVLSTLIAGGSERSLPFLTFDPLKKPRCDCSTGHRFAITLLGILGTHEFGHYFHGALEYGASVSLPYFILAPPPLPFGTLGAVIVMRSPARDRNSLFDIAVADARRPDRGRARAAASGCSWSRVGPIPPDATSFGDSLADASS